MLRLSMLWRDDDVLYGAYFSVTTQFFGRDITLLPSAYLRVATQISCRDRTFLILSRNLCRDKEKSVMTWFFCIQFNSVLRPEDPCRDIKTPLQL